jgi:hypothetical protein
MIIGRKESREKFVNSSRIMGKATKFLMDTGGGYRNNIMFLVLAGWVVFYFCVSSGVLDGLGEDSSAPPRKWYPSPARDSDSNNATLKRILLFTPFFYMKTWGLNLGASSFKRCPVTNCHLSNNRNDLSTLSDFDAILFHLRNMNGNERSVTVPNPKRRRLGQRYVMFLMESPQHDYFNYDSFKGE